MKLDILQKLSVKTGVRNPEAKVFEFRTLSEECDPTSYFGLKLNPGDVILWLLKLMNSFQQADEESDII